MLRARSRHASRSINYNAKRDRPIRPRSSYTLDGRSRREPTPRPRAADDFATIRARMEELRREREGAQAADGDLEGKPPTQGARAVRWPASEIGAGARAGPTI